jgi:phosphomannomutase
MNLSDLRTLRNQVEAWIADEVDPGAAAELRGLLTAGAYEELAERFRAPLSFGTAGLRGPVRAGPNGMNRQVVRRAASGLATWLSHTGRGHLVVIGYDGRHGSLDFARDSAAVFAAAGFEAKLLPQMLPTPVLAYAVQYLGAAVGVMVTASHNPPQDNGYKVYLGDGAQIAPPTDLAIEASIRAVGPSRYIELSERYEVLGPEVITAYVRDIADLIAPGPRNLRIVHTALHGVGTDIAQRVMTAAGFAPMIEVPEQARPDPNFPTVAFPNPEEPGALDLAVALARREHADLIIANDPDADRCAVAVPVAAGWRMLRGDELGVLLADALMAKGVEGTYATTIVSSGLLGAIAAKHSLGYVETLTGFKWISRAAPDLVFGYEEALGYAVAPELVRDKDGISAALLIAERAAALASAGSSLLARLDELASEYGRYATDQLSVRVADLSLIPAMMARLRAHAPTALLGQPVTVTDLSPSTDAVRLRWANGRVVVRPSGTEPKLKAYLEVVLADGSAEQADAALAQLRHEMTAVLGL